MKPGKLTNFTEIYSLTTKQKYDIDNLMQQHLLFKQFVIQSCDGSSVAPLTDNSVYQEQIHEDDYFDVKSNERIYLDLRVSSGYVKQAEKLKKTAQKLPFTYFLKKQQPKN